jgi:hypothetical protein
MHAVQPSEAAVALAASFAVSLRAIVVKEPHISHMNSLPSGSQACDDFAFACRKVHLQAEPIDVYLEASIFEELKHFANSITNLPFSSTTAAAHKQQKTTALLLRQMIQTATVQTTIVDPKDVAGKFGKWHFGKWCASPVASPVPTAHLLAKATEMKSGVSTCRKIAQMFEQAKLQAKSCSACEP